MKRVPKNNFAGAEIHVYHFCLGTGRFLNLKTAAAP
jgi:hypothetical protein